MPALIVTSYGPAAHEALAAAVDRAQADNRLAPVTVVVPSNYVGLGAQRALARRRGIAAVTFATPYQLAHQLGGCRLAAEGKCPVSTTVIAAAVRRTLRNDPGYFTSVAGHPATEQALVRAHRELSELDSPALNRLADTSPRAREVVKVHRAVGEILDASYNNEQHLVQAAVQALQEHRVEPTPLAALGRLFVFLPQDLSSSHRKLLRALGQVTAVTVIAGKTGVAAADAAVRDSLNGIAENLTAGFDEEAVQPAIADRGLSVSDPDDEVRHALRAVVKAIASGTAPDRCAIVYGASNPYKRLVTESLKAAGIGYFGASTGTAALGLLGRSLLNLLALPESDYSRREVMAWLSFGPVRLPDRRTESRWYPPTSAWERVSRSAGVTAGLEQWEQRLDRYATDQRDEADHMRRDDDELSRARRLKGNAEHADELLKFIKRLKADLAAGEQETTWQGLARWCKKLVSSYLGGVGARERWPAEDRRLADIVMNTIDRLGDLDTIDDSPSTGTWLKALRIELSKDISVSGRFGTGVMVGSVEQAIGLELDLAVVCGLAEGVFPARHLADALLPDRERAEAVPDLALVSNRSAQDHRSLLAVLAAAKQSLLLYPRGDLRNAAERVPSRWLLDTVQAREGHRPKPEELARSTGDWLTEVPSFVAGLRRSRFPATQQEYDMRVLLDHCDAGGDVADNDLCGERAEIRRAVACRQARQSDRFTRFDGNLLTDGDLQGVRLDRPTDSERPVSASRLEKWAGCPHAYFVRYVLGVEPVEEVEDQYRLSALERGSLVHRILDAWLAEALEADAVPDAAVPWPAKWRVRLLEIANQECDLVEERGLSGSRIYWRTDRRRLLADLELFINHDQEFRTTHRSKPLRTELSFAMPGRGHSEPVTVRLDDGRALRLQGAIDRVDRAIDGGLIVIDYKTGKPDDYQILEPDNPTGNGTRLQLLLYAAAAQELIGSPDSEVRAMYWFVTTKGGFNQCGYNVDRAVSAAGQPVLTSVVDGISKGVFPLRPEKPGWRQWISCPYCEPDGLGTRDQWDDWQRKRLDPDLWDYLAILDPKLLEETTTTTGGDLSD